MKLLNQCMIHLNGLDWDTFTVHNFEPTVARHNTHGKHTQRQQLDKSVAIL